MFFVDQVMLFLVHLFFPLQVIIVLYINQSFLRNRVTYGLLLLIVLVKLMFLVCLFQFHLLELILLTVPRIQYRYYLFQKIL
jgi:hypothetical protein